MVQAIAGAGRRGEVKSFAMDHSSETLDAVERGDVYAALASDPYECGYQAVQGLLAISRYTPLELPAPGRGSITVPGRLLHQNDVRDFRQRPAQLSVGG
jgi:ABC-type sugar transport system substrate-binding protein